MRAERRARLLRRARPWLSAGILVLAALAFGYQSLRIGQDANFDLRNYHFYNGYAFLHGRLGFDYVPADAQTFFNPLIDVPFYLLIQSLPPRAFGFALGALHGMAFWLLYLVAGSVIGGHRVHTILLALICAGVGMHGAGTISELGTTMHDLTLTPFILASLLFLFVQAPGAAGISARPRPAFVIGSGLLLGIAAGLKYTFAIYAPGVALALAILLFGSRRVLFLLLQWCIGALVGFAVTAGFWMYELWWRFGNPFGFLYNGIFRSPYFEPVNVRDARFFPRSALQSIFYPLYFRSSYLTVSEVPLQEARFAFVYALIGVVALLWIIRRASRGRRPTPGAPAAPRTHWMLIAFFVSSYVLWQVQFSIYRYLIPLEVLAPLMIFVLLCQVIARPHTQLLACSAVFLVIVSVVSPPNWGRVPWGAAFFGTVPPPIPDPSGALAIISTKEPVGFLIPAFPSQVRFVRIAPSSVAPSTRLDTEIHHLVASHPGPVYVVSDRASIVSAQRALEGYGLALPSGACREVTNNLAKGILWCETNRSPAE